jgi:hypothetical protein
MTVWVERDRDGTIASIYANRQDGYAEEELPDDDKDVTQFHQKASPPAVDRLGNLEAALIAKGIITNDDLVSARR